MDRVTVICTDPSVYRGALTRGHQYAVLAMDEARQHVKVRGDKGRARWFPALCFDLSEENARSLLPYTIWIEMEAGEPSTGTPEDDNTDVTITFADGTRWGATFFSYANIAALTEKNRRTGENLSGKYLWASDMILVDEVSRPCIEEVVEHLISTCEYHRVFSRLTPAGEDSG
jgi:hypothetical protein